jgi:putative MATE family efflux protein
MPPANEQTDLTKGPIAKQLINFALPIIASNIFMQLYNVADSIIVGQYIGSNALAAVMVSFPIMMLMFALLMGLGIGSNILVAQYKGAGDNEKLEKAINTTFSLSIIISVLMTLIGLLFSRPILVALGTPADILDDAAIYLALTFIGAPGTVLFYLCGGLARGLGDSRWPMYSMIMASFTNIALDLLFIIVFGWGVASVALATLISMFLSGLVLTFRFINRSYGVRLTLTGMRHMDRHIVALVFRLGGPASIQNVVVSMGMVVIQVFSNYFGSNYIASNAIIMRVDGFAVMPMFGIAAAVTSFVGQNTGAGNTERVKKGISTSLWITIGFSIIIGILLYFFGFYLMRAFTDNQAVLEMGFNGLRFLAFCYVFMGIQQCMTGALQGAGATGIPAIISMVGVGIRIVITYFLSIIPYNADIHSALAEGVFATIELAKTAGIGLTHYMGLYHSMGISMICGAAMVLLYFRFGRWQTKDVVHQKP